MLGFASFGAEVRHQHLRKGGMGQIEIGENSISFKEAGKKSAHSWEWKYENIQQLTLSPTELRLLSYDDAKWQLGRDREYVFDQLPKEFFTEAYPRLRERLGQRFAEHLGVPEVTPLWEVGVKLQHKLGGSQGTLRFAEDRIGFKTDKTGESHTWLYTEIENVSSSGRFDLSIITAERSSWSRAPVTDYDCQLKQALTEERYNNLWRTINRANELKVAGLGLPR